MIDLLYHATIYYEICKFVQESEPAALMYKMVIEKAKAHERNVLEYKDHQASHRGANSAPSYNNPLLSAHALSNVTSLSTKTIKLPTGEQTVRLPTIIHCYLLTHCLKDGPVATVIMANVVANVASLMSEATAPRMGKLATSARVLIISKLFVVPRLQPRQDRALTEARSHSRTDTVPRGATVAKAKEVATVNTRRRRPQRSCRSGKHMQ